MDKISVIVPIYNAENYLMSCIESIINQTYENIELILVDDGSSDSSGKIADHYEKKDIRIKVLHKKNNGVSSARNAGLEVASGSYIIFIDADDELIPGCLEEMHKKAIETEADIVICSIDEVLEINIDKETVPIDKEKMIWGTHDIIAEYCCRAPYTGTCWGKLYKSSVVGNVRFPSQKFAEDTYFYVLVAMNSKKVVLIPYVGYKYCRRNGTITTSDNGIRRCWDSLNVAEFVYRYVEYNYKDLSILAANRYSNYVWTLVKWKIIKNSDKYSLRKLKNKISIDIIKKSELSKLKKIIIILCIFSKF